MKKLIDQELDSLFKAASEGYHPEFDAAAWEAMTEKLNQPKSLTWKKWIPFSLAGLIIFSTGIWVGIKFNQNSDYEVKERKTQISNNDKTSETENKIEIIAGSSPEAKKEAISVQDVSSMARPAGSNKYLNDNQHEINVAKEEADLVDFRDESSSANVGVNDNEQVPDFKITSSENQVDTILNDGFDDEINKDSTNNNNIEGNHNQIEKSGNGIFIRILASPDLSSINYGTTRLMGSNYALLGEYRFSKRWSLSTGLIWSLKKYSTQEEVVYSGYSADQLDGACRIMDIPINIYYHFNPYKKVSFYAGAGFSSYIMMTEDYTYTVFATSGNRTYSTQVEGKNNEWFKVLNLSMGIQYPLNSQWHIQAEPFLKAPLAGVGEGDVLLSSLGVFLGLKYKINIIK